MGDVMPAALVDPVQAQTGLTAWPVALQVLAGMVTFSWLTR